MSWLLTFSTRDADRDTDGLRPAARAVGVGRAAPAVGPAHGQRWAARAAAAGAVAVAQAVVAGGAVPRVGRALPGPAVRRLRRRHDSGALGAGVAAGAGGAASRVGATGGADA